MNEQAARRLAEQIVAIAERPTEVGAGEFAAAQSSLASTGYALAKVVLGWDPDDETRKLLEGNPE